MNTILQLRVHPALKALKQRLEQEALNCTHDVVLSYITSRGLWYHSSWKGTLHKSGGVATNIGIHFFDLMLWLFGSAGAVRVYHSDPKRMAGFVELERARVRWFLSVDHNDLPFPVTPGRPATYRSITIDGSEIEFSEGFGDLHTEVYRETLAGRGFGLDAARPSIELTHRIRQAPLSNCDDMAHPFLRG